MIPKEVCHYTKPDTALEKILFGKKIRLNQFGLMNDPRESKPRSFSVFDVSTAANSDDLRKHTLIEQAGNASHKILAEEWKILCVTLNRPRLRASIQDVNRMLSNHLAPGYARPRMWAQYAENHKGVCILFDGVKLHENIQRELGERCLINQGRVLYANNISGSYSLHYPNIEKYGSIEAARKHIFAYYEDYFFRKLRDWENETEYRWIAHSPANAPEYVSIDRAIKAVLVGTDFPSSYESSLTSLCKELKIPAGKMKWHDGLPYPDFGSIYKP